MKRLLHFLGTLLAIGFVVIALLRGARELPAIDLLSPAIWLWLALSLGLYVLSQVVAARAWAGILAIFGVRLRKNRAESQLLISQIGKYIPGNVMHLLGRFSLARADGVSGASIGIAMLIEVAFVLTVGGALLALLLLVAPETLMGRLLPDGSDLSLRIVAVILAIFLVAGITVGLWLFSRRNTDSQRALLLPGKSVMPLALHAINFLLLGQSLACTAHAANPTENMGLLVPTAVFIVAWTIGFLMPGAPGGLGVRDGLIVLGLGLFIGDGPALAAAVLHRLVSVAGDLTVFAMGYWLRKTTSPAISKTGIDPH